MTARVLPFVLLALLAGCRRAPSPTVFIDPALVTLIPADTVVLAGVRVEQLAKTQFWKDYVEKGRVPALESFRRRTGLNVPRDLWELLLSSDGKNTIVFLRGKFSDMGMEPRLEREGVQRMSYKGLTMIGDESYAVLFLNPSTAAVAPAPVLRRVVDTRNTLAGVPHALGERIKKIPSTNQAWFAASVGGMIPGGEALSGNWANLARMARSVEYARGGLDLRTEFHANVYLETGGAQQAERLSAAVRALLGIGRLSTTDQQREMLSVYDGMHVAQEDGAVHFSTDIPYAVLEKAAAEIPLFGAP